MEPADRPYRTVLIATLLQDVAALLLHGDSGPPARPQADRGGDFAEPFRHLVDPAVLRVLLRWKSRMPIRG
ncbi:MAG: hypothetical protein HY331_16610 [Chloroflexi bacterium]|nr:hypothetical protein [Chloroflexota bacterium]